MGPASHPPMQGDREGLLMRQHLHLSKLFFHIFSRYFKDHDAKIRTLFLALSIYVHLCPAMSIYCAEKACIYQKKSVTLQRK